MDSIMGAVERFMQENELEYERVEGRSALVCNLSGDNNGFRFFFDIHEDDERLIIYATTQTRIPEQARVPIAEFLARANYGLRIGNFELDMSDGEVRYKVSVDVEGGALVPQMVKNMVAAGLSTFDHYFPGLMSVGFAGIDPKAAIEEIEEA